MNLPDMPPPPWHCPTCGRELRAPRSLAIGCVSSKEVPVGDCPMHRTIMPEELLRAPRAAAS